MKIGRETQTHLVKVILNPGDNVEVQTLSPCIGIKQRDQDGVLSLKFSYENGAVLYVPLPDEIEFGVETTAGPMTN